MGYNQPLIWTMLLIVSKFVFQKIFPCATFRYVVHIMLHNKSAHIYLARRLQGNAFASCYSMVFNLNIFVEITILRTLGKFPFDLNTLKRSNSFEGDLQLHDFVKSIENSTCILARNNSKNYLIPDQQKGLWSTTYNNYHWMPFWESYR